VQSDKVPWKRLCQAVELIEAERTMEGFLRRSLEQIELLLPFDHSLAVLTHPTVLPGGEHVVRNPYDVPVSVDDGRLHGTFDASWGRRLFLCRHSPRGLWNEYFLHAGRAGWKCGSVEPSPSLPRVEAVDWYRHAGPDSTESGAFVRRHDTRFVLSISNYADAQGAGFRFSLYRNRRHPFISRDEATARSLFPHLHNHFILAMSLEPRQTARMRFAAAAAGLSEREQDVAALLSERLSHAEIADRLFISRHTVKRHIEHIYWKLGVAKKRDVRSRLLGESAAPGFYQA